jgi:hypothetical protein
MEISYCALLNTYSNPGETAGDFRARMTQTSREQRDAAVDELKTKYGKKLKDMEDDMTKALAKIDAQKAQASSAKLSTAVQIGTSLLGALFGNKSGLAGAASMLKSTTVNSASRAWKESQDVGAAQTAFEKEKLDYDAMNKELEVEVKTLQDKYDPAALTLETTKLTPLKKNISTTATGILWLPYERVGSSLKQAWV